MRMLAIGLMMAAGSAFAQTTCTTIGNFTTCSDGSSYNRIGNQVYGSDGSTSQRIGNQTFINPGTVQPVYPPPQSYQPIQPMMPLQPLGQPRRCGYNGYGQYVCI